MCDCNVPTSQEVKKTKQNPSQKQEEVSEEYDKKKMSSRREGELEQTLIAGKRLTLMVSHYAGDRGCPFKHL